MYVYINKTYIFIQQEFLHLYIDIFNLFYFCSIPKKDDFFNVREKTVGCFTGKSFMQMAALGKA